MMPGIAGNLFQHIYIHVHVVRVIGAIPVTPGIYIQWRPKVLQCLIGLYIFQCPLPNSPSIASKLGM
jgi:hypothetical protein